MKKRIITNQTIKSFEKYLLENEKAPATIDKYMRDIRCFAEYAAEHALDKTLVLDYKGMLEQNYAIRSANSMLAALNAFLRFVGWNDLCVKQFKVQKEAYCSEEKELSKAEYTALVRTAEQKKNERLSLVVQTICGTGIRVSACRVLRWRLSGEVRQLFPVRARQEKYLLSRLCKRSCFGMRWNKELLPAYCL